MNISYLFFILKIAMLWSIPGYSTQKNNDTDKCYHKVVKNFSAGIIQTTGSQLGAILSARRHLAKSGDNSGHHSLGDVIAT